MACSFAFVFDSVLFLLGLHGTRRSRRRCEYAYVINSPPRVTPSVPVQCGPPGRDPHSSRTTSWLALSGRKRTKLG
jgi:hypothetical protein